MERRRAARYELHVPVLFRGEDSGPTHAAFTRDVSAAGAYILCEEDRYPARGDTLAIQLILPPVAAVEAQGMKLEFKGRVVRVADSREQSGFVVLAESGMELKTGSKNSEQNGDWP